MVALVIVDVLLLEFVFVGACFTRVEGVKLLDIIDTHFGRITGYSSVKQSS